MRSRRFLHGLGACALYLGVGLLFAESAEFAEQIEVFHSIDRYIGTFPVYILLISLFFGLGGLFRRVLGDRLAAALVCYTLAGMVGLAFEWIAVGNSPWGNPAACQPGMFCFWAMVLYMPRIFTDSRPGLGRLRIWLLGCFALYVAILLAIGAFVTGPVEVRGAVVGLLFALGYIPLNLFALRYFAVLRKPRTAAIGMQALQGR
jgi:hypothetical protein